MEFEDEEYMEDFELTYSEICNMVENMIINSIHYSQYNKFMDWE